MLWFTWLLSLVLKFVVIHCDTQKQRQIEFIPRINWTTNKNTKYKKRDKNIGKEWNWITTYNYIAINPSSQIKKYFNRILTFGCMKIGTNKTKQKKGNMTSHLYMYNLLLVDIIETKYLKEDNHSVTLDGKRI